MKVPKEMQCGRFVLSFLKRPLVMGILNITPDSFSDGWQYSKNINILQSAENMIYDGVDIIDIGGESSRPGASPVSVGEEIRRVIPVIKKLYNLNIPLSIDTYKPEVMIHALSAGVDMINDIFSFRFPGAINVIRNSNCGLCIMNMIGSPQVNINYSLPYLNAVDHVKYFLAERIRSLVRSGINVNRISIDPGFGFGEKSIKYNFSLLANLKSILSIHNPQLPLLVGISRKSMLGQITGKKILDRAASGIAAIICAVERGATIVRVHDVAQTVDALKVWSITNSMTNNMN